MRSTMLLSRPRLRHRLRLRLELGFVLYVALQHFNGGNEVTIHDVPNGLPLGEGQAVGHQDV